MMLGAFALPAAAENSGGLITDEPVTISYWVNMHSNAAKVLSTWNDNEIFQELERITGVHVDFVHPPIGQEQEQYNLMVAANDMTDIICWEYPDGADKAIEDGIYRPIEDLMEYMPYYSALIEANPEVRKQLTTNNGHIWGWAEVMLPEDNAPYSVSPWGGPAVRGDYLDQLGLEDPETIDDWYNMLVAFRDELGISVPLILDKNGNPGFSIFSGAWGVGSGFYREDNVVKYGPIEEGFKSYLETMNKWYTEGLLDPDFAATASDSNFYSEYLTTGKAGAITTTYQDIVPLYNSLFSEGEEGYVKAVPYPVTNAGDERHLGCISYEVESGNGRRDYLTTACDEGKIEVLARWRDYWYSDEATMLFNYGIEGRSYTMEDGKPQFTELLTNNPDGLDYAVASWKYKLFCHTYRYNAFAMPQDQVDASWASIGTWISNNDRANQMPSSSVPMDHASEYTSIMTEVDTYRDQMILKFIMGVEPIDQFDAYVAEMKQLNIERAIELQQMGLDTFNSH